MKWAIYLALVTTFIYAVGVPATKGAVTEGLFILKNKQLDVQQTIQSLKKELTHCFTKKEQPQKKLFQYHCKLRQMLYPTYIDELNRLARRAKRNIQALEKAKQTEKLVFDTIMKRTFLLDEKIALEKQLITTIFAIDDAQQKAKTLTLPSPLLKSSIEKDEKLLSSLRSRLVKVNGDLFTDELEQEVFFDRLKAYSRL